jgi:hypothetical protein
MIIDQPIGLRARLGRGSLSAASGIGSSKGSSDKGMYLARHETGFA